MNRRSNTRFPCGRIARRTFLADIGMGFTGLALGSLLHRDAQAGTPHIHTPGCRPNRDVYFVDTVPEGFGVS